MKVWFVLFAMPLIVSGLIFAYFINALRKDRRTIMTRTSLPKGKGIFIWGIGITENGDPNAIAAAAVEMGFEHVLLHIHDGSYAEDNPNMFYGADLTPYVAALRAANIECWGWGAVYPKYWEQGVAVAVASIRKHNLDGYVVDAEQAMKGYPEIADLLMYRLRQELPDTPIGLSSYRYPKLHPELPWKEFRKYVDFDMPQVYWEKAHNPGEQLVASYTEFQAMTPVLPYVVSGSAYKNDGWSCYPTDVNELCVAAALLNIKAVNFWVWFQTKRDLPLVWKAIQNCVVGNGNEEPEIPEECEYMLDINFKALVQGQNVRSAPSIGYFNKIGTLTAGQILGPVLDMKFLSSKECWLRFDEGWVALVHNGNQYLQQV